MKAETHAVNYEFSENAVDALISRKSYINVKNATGKVSLEYLRFFLSKTKITFIAMKENLNITFHLILSLFRF